MGGNDTGQATCRCGRQTAASHPCHHGGYTCPNEGTERFYAHPLGSFSIAGAQLKVVASQTVACDEHWREFAGHGRHEPLLTQGGALLPVAVPSRRAARRRLVNRGSSVGGGLIVGGNDTGQATPGRGVTEADVRTMAGVVFTDEGVDVFYDAPNRHLHNATPRQYVNAGDGDKVIDLLHALAEGVAL